MENEFSLFGSDSLTDKSTDLCVDFDGYQGVRLQEEKVLALVHNAVKATQCLVSRPNRTCSIQYPLLSYAGD